MCDETGDRFGVSPVRAHFLISESQDEALRDLILSSSSTIPIEDTGSTIVSLQDTVDLIVKKYGDNWRDCPECKCVVIWASRVFDIPHVNEVVPDLFDLCLEYRENNTVNGKPMPDNFYLLAFAVVDPSYPKEDI